MAQLHELENVVLEGLLVLDHDVGDVHEGIQLAPEEQVILGARPANQDTQGRDLAVPQQESLPFKKWNGIGQRALDSGDGLGLALVDEQHQLVDPLQAEVFEAHPLDGTQLQRRLHLAPPLLLVEGLQVGNPLVPVELATKSNALMEAKLEVLRQATGADQGHLPLLEVPHLVRQILLHVQGMPPVVRERPPQC